MKNKSWLSSTLFVLFSTALLWMSCSARGANLYDNQSFRPPIYQQAPTPCIPIQVQNPCNTCPPIPPPEPCYQCPTSETPCNPCDQLNVSYVDNCGVRVTARQPQLCTQGDNYVLDLEVEALQDVCEVVVSAILPDCVSLIRSSPDGVINTGRHITWNIDGLKKSERISNRLTLRSEREGQMCVCFCVKATPVQFCAVLCAKPILECSKVGPVEVNLCDQVNYCISVTNSGTCPAQDVMVIDQVPPELEHASGQRTLTFNLGCIEACQTKKFNVCFKAARLGKACNTIIASSCNACPCTDTFCTLITQCGVSLDKEGPQEVRIGGSATYTITVTNTGNKTLKDVVITDLVPQMTTIVDAKGAEIHWGKPMWKLAELKAGEKQTVQLILTSCMPGYTVNRASVITAQGCRDNAEVGTLWRGVPALSSQIASDGPVCLGNTITYYIRVVNQGSEQDTNVSTVVRFPAAVTPTSVSGATSGSISDNVVIFTPANVLAPRQTMEYRVEAVSKESGDARIKLEVSSDNFKTPIIQEESTIVN